jgi:hypothetical protein
VFGHRDTPDWPMRYGYQVDIGGEPNVRLKLSFMPDDFETFDVGVATKSIRALDAKSLDNVPLTCTVQSPVTITQTPLLCELSRRRGEPPDGPVHRPNGGTKSIYVRHSEDPAPLLVRRRAF